MKGSAIIAAFILIVIGSLIVGGYLLYISKESYMTKRLNDSIKALYVAEAGLEMTLGSLAKDSNWTDNGTYSGFCGEGDYLAVYAGDNKKGVITSEGVVREDQRIITENVTRQSVFSYGILAKEKIKLHSNTFIDSYDSTRGPYDKDVNSNEHGNIRTNAGDGIINEPYEISLDPNSHIYGDVMLGPNGDTVTDIDVPNNADIGNASVAPSELVFPPVSPPAGLTNRGSVSLKAGDNITIDQSGQYDLIYLRSNSSITINGNVILYVTGQFELSSNSKIDIPGGSKLTLYLGSEFILNSNSGINNIGRNPSDLIIYGTDSMTTVLYESNVDLYGALYMPNADFFYNSNTQLFGALSAKSVELKSNASIHYDETLAGEGPPTDGLITDSWHEVFK